MWVEPFPPTGDRQQVSRGGAQYHAWAADGRLIYQSSRTGGEIKVLELAGAPAEPTVVSEDTLTVPRDLQIVTLARDERFLAVRTTPPLPFRRVSLVLNWDLELQRRFGMD